ncbi:hypothetical protein [Dyella silvatica]|uniref:hypothetical protein n=1 Tax=Dyella silvatica TaxID=2992128 RepID=UPI00225AC6FF|nr:hypothetical protein [Dyella silvatica]
MKAGIYEFGPEGSNVLIWVAGGWVFNGDYEVFSDDGWKTCWVENNPSAIARRVGDVPSITRRDYNEVIETFIEQRTTKCKSK